MPALLWSLTSLEMALGAKAEKKGLKFKNSDGLCNKLDMAFSKQWLNIREVVPQSFTPSDRKTYQESFIRCFPRIRKNLAHGTWILDTPFEVARIFDDIARVINNLFKL